MKNLLSRISLFLFVLFIFSQCHDTPSSSEKFTEQPFAEFQQQFKPGMFGGELPFDFQVDWSDPVQGYSNKMQAIYYEFPVIRDAGLDAAHRPARSDASILAYKLIALEHDGTSEFYLLKFIGDRSDQTAELTWADPVGFTGQLYLFEAGSEVVSAKKYEEGTAVGTISAISKERYEEWKNARFRMTETCVTETTYHYTDWYQLYPDGSKKYLDTSFDGISYTEVCYYENLFTGGGGSGGGGGSTYSVYENRSYKGEILKSESFKDSKAECVYNRLNNLSKDFASLIQRFDGEFPVSHLRWDLEVIDGDTNAITQAPSIRNNKQISPDYVITIILNNHSYSRSGIHYRPNLMVAKTMAHEVIHAEMFRKLMSLADQGHLNFTGWSRDRQVEYINRIRNNFPGIYDYYRRFNDWQHQQMANHYRESIAYILRQFDHYQHSWQFYMDLAWEGLMSYYDEEKGKMIEVIAWEKLSDKEQKRIKEVIISYTVNNQFEACKS